MSGVVPRASSPAKRGRGTMRSMLDGAAAASIPGVCSRSMSPFDILPAAAPSTMLRMVPLPRFTGEDTP